MTTADRFVRTAATVLEECGRAIRSIDPREVEAYINAVESAEQVFFVGVGRVMLSLQAVAKRYRHLGFRTVVVGQITEPALTKRDLLVVGSSSGETIFPVAIAKKAKRIGATVAHIGSNPSSSLNAIRDLFVRIPVAGKTSPTDSVRSTQPMTALFEQSLLLFGDITAKMIIDRGDIVMDDLWRYHANLE